MFLFRTNSDSDGSHRDERRALTDNSTENNTKQFEIGHYDTSEIVERDDILESNKGTSYY